MGSIYTYPGEGNSNTMKNWIWFGAGGDSIEIRAPGGYVSTNFGEEREANHNTASYFRRRLTGDGVVQVQVSVDEYRGDTVEYTLFIHLDGPAPATALRATGQRAMLIL